MNNSFKDLLKNHELINGYDRLYEASEAYEEILGKDFIYTLEDGSYLKVYFNKEDFYHLVGLHKLTDISEVSKSRKSTLKIYKDIRNKQITYKTIEKSTFNNEIFNRLTLFQDIKEVVYNKAIIDFDKTKVPSTLLKGDVLLYQSQVNENKILSLIKRRGKESIYTPETFIVQHDDYYFKDQIELKVVDFEIVERKNK